MKLNPVSNQPTHVVFPPVRRANNIRFLLLVFVGFFLGGCAHSSKLSVIPLIQEADAFKIATKAAEHGEWHVMETTKAEPHKGGWNVYLLRLHERHETEFVKVVISPDGKKARVWPTYMPSVSESLQRSMTKEQLR